MTNGTSTAFPVVMLGARVVVPLAGLLAGLVALAAWPGAARSATDDEDPNSERTPRGVGAPPAATQTEEVELEAQGPAGVTQEWIGLELTPISLSLPGAQGLSSGKPASQLDVGLGGSIRIGRHRWEYAYLIPIQASLYVGSQTILTYLQVEGGLIVPRTDRRLELGMGAGIGVLSVAHATNCDGSCVIGGKGALLSFVARYLFHETRGFSAGVNIRALLTLGTSEGELFGYYTGDADIVVAGLEVAFGRGRAR